MATFEDFQKLDVRVGRIVEVNTFPEAHNPSYKLRIDFGEDVGVKKSVAQLPQNYSQDELEGKQVLGVVNLPPKQIGPVMSEALTLGVPDEDGDCVLVEPERDVEPGAELY